MFVRRFAPNQYRFSPFPLTQTKITKKRYHRLLTDSLFMIHWDTNASNLSPLPIFGFAFILHLCYITYITNISYLGAFPNL